MLLFQNTLCPFELQVTVLLYRPRPDNPDPQPMVPSVHVECVYVCHSSACQHSPIIHRPLAALRTGGAHRDLPSQVYNVLRRRASTLGTRRSGTHRRLQAALPVLQTQPTAHCARTGTLLCWWSLVGKRASEFYSGSRIQYHSVRLPLCLSGLGREVCSWM